MMQKTLLAAAALASISGMAQAAETPSQQARDLNVEYLSLHNEPPMLGLHWSREVHGARLDRQTEMANAQVNRAGTSPNMAYHGGKIMPTVVAKAIFWGASWANATYVGDKIAGMDSFYVGHNGSNYAKTVNEYTGTNGTVGSTLTYQGHVVDTSAATGGASTSAILNEVCKVASSGNISPDPSGNGYYPVYTDVKRGSAGYCAWHSAGTCGGVKVQFAFFFDLAGDSGCNPADIQTGHSQGLAALANVSGHELEEARSDPSSPGAWYDPLGNENGDKCAWAFHVPYVTFTDGSIWKLQGEWSNKAYTAGTGYANSSGQKGCLDGH